MPRAAAICPQPGCPNPQPCPTHTPKPWAGRSSAASRGYGWQWQKARADILRRNPTCRCGQPATEVDHIRPKADGGGDEQSNLAPICERCHRRKSLTEAQRHR